MVLLGAKKRRNAKGPLRGDTFLMSNALEKRLSKLEKQAAKKKQKKKVCNCRVTTPYHSAACLDAVLRGIPRVCPVHGFRELGSFLWRPKQYPLGFDDDRFCPCPPHPWRSYVLSGSRDWDEGAAARESWDKLAMNAPAVDPQENARRFQEDNRRTAAILAKYEVARQRWLDSSGRELPALEELVKSQMKRGRQHASQS